jgi:hypothetical protein
MYIIHSFAVIHVYATGCICLPVLPIIYLDSGRQNTPTQHFSLFLEQIVTLTFLLSGKNDVHANKEPKKKRKLVIL